jgi:hypothetical protein
MSCKWTRIARRPFPPCQFPEGGAGIQRLAPGERGLRGEEQFSVELPQSVPAVSAKLKNPLSSDRNFEDVVKSAQAAAVLILGY